MAKFLAKTLPFYPNGAVARVGTAPTRSDRYVKLRRAVYYFGGSPYCAACARLLQDRRKAKPDAKPATEKGITFCTRCGSTIHVPDEETSAFRALIDESFPSFNSPKFFPFLLERELAKTVLKEAGRL